MAHGVSISHERMELMRRMKAYAIRVAMLLWNFPHAEHTAEQVVAPQHDAANVTSFEQLASETVY